MELEVKQGVGPSEDSKAESMQPLDFSQNSQSEICVAENKMKTKIPSDLQTVNDPVDEESSRKQREKEGGVGPSEDSKAESMQPLSFSGFSQNSQPEIHVAENEMKTQILSDLQTVNDPVDEESSRKQRERGASNSADPNDPPKIMKKIMEDKEESTAVNESKSLAKWDDDGAPPDPLISKLENTKDAEDVNDSGDGHGIKEHSDIELEEDKDKDQEMNLDDDDAKQAHGPGLPELKWIITVSVLLIAVGFGFIQKLSVPSPPVPKQSNVVDVFNQEMEKLKTSFPSQRPELWRRSLIHLRRHLKSERPTEPVSLILTSGHGAERTLGCLAQCLAQAFSTAQNSSVLNINGKSKASQDSDQVKMDIDSELRKAFEGQTFAAVIHHFEELPPGSTLIFYRYCDHENAAFKNVFLAFTIMLDAESEVPSSVSLGGVEDMVYDHLKQKFVSSRKAAMFNQMDVDKLSGLWSRISHLILPVVAEEKTEEQGCGNCDI